MSLTRCYNQHTQYNYSIVTHHHNRHSVDRGSSYIQIVNLWRTMKISRWIQNDGLEEKKSKEQGSTYI